MRSFRLIQSLLAAARFVFVVVGMLCVVALMGATTPQRLIRETSIPRVHGLAALPAQDIPQDNSQAELLFDLPDAPDTLVGQISPGVRQVMMEVTAYCACTKCCGPNAAGITASGRDVGYNDSLFVAADPTLPFGTKVLVPGYSNHPVEVIDRGSAIRGDKIDVFFPTHEAALEWGRKQLVVTILE